LIRDLLYAAAARLAEAGVDNPRLDARILLARAMGISREQLIAAERQPNADEEAAFEAAIARRAGREPLAYIIGRKEFWSLDLAVGPGVLVPRPETETLIEAALAALPDRRAPLAIADLGTGSGALLIAALWEYRAASGTGFERSPAALSYAQRNLQAHGLEDRAQIVAGDWNGASGPFDLIFSNPPYIPAADIAGLEPEVRDHEPRAALDGGEDGLCAYRDLAGLLPSLLRPGGLAILELGMGQAGQVESLFGNLITLRVAPDLAGISRALVLKAAK
jgi:release factor glutamine methyltransferase